MGPKYVYCRRRWCFHISFETFPINSILHVLVCVLGGVRWRSVVVLTMIGIHSVKGKWFVKIEDWEHLLFQDSFFADVLLVVCR